MNNEEAVKILNTVLFFGKCDCQMEEIEECLKMAIEALKKSEWISCSERLPEDGDTYLVTIEYNGEVIGVDAASYSPFYGYIDKHWDTFEDWKEDDDTCYHVTAWMPLPEEYKKEGNK